MKKVLFLILIMLLFSLQGIGQGYIHKSMYDEFGVQTIEVLKHTFTVGDTLTFTIGSLPNGDFMSAVLKGFMSKIVRPSEPYHLPAHYANYKFIITNIVNIKLKDGLNSETTLVFYLKKNSPVWINLATAISKKEILL